MKKSFRKVLAVIMSVVMLLGATSITSFAADEKVGSFDNITKAFSDWVNALANYEMSDFNGFVTAILGLFGFKGAFEGVHSIPSLVDEWFAWLGDLGGLYETIINFLSTSELLNLINGFLSK